MHFSNPSRFRQVIRLAVVATVGVALASCSASMGARSSGDDEKPERKKREVIIPVEVTMPERGDISAYYETTSRIEAERRVEVATEGNGRCVSLEVDEGEHVTAGQVLAELKKDEARAQLRQARVNVEKTRVAYELAKKQLSEGHGTKVDTDNTRFSYEDAQADLEMRQIALDNLTIRAPIDGVVTHRTIQVGGLVSAGTHAFTIVDPDSFMLTINPPEKEMPRLAVGQKAEVRVDALPGRRFQAQVRRINPNVDSSSGTVKVVLDFQPEDRAKLPESAFARVNLVMATRQNVILLPKEAILEEDARKFVFVIRESEDAEPNAESPDEPILLAERVEVGTALEDAARVQVFRGLQGTELVVINGQYSLKPEARVSIMDLSEELGAKSDTPADEALAAAEKRREEIKDGNGQGRRGGSGKGPRHH